MTGPRIGELFAGYGGLGMGVQAVLGGEVAWLSEIDPGACRVLAHRFPGVPNHGDVTAVDWAAVEPVDVLCGGSPCQDVSGAGKRAGMTAGTRSNLWVAMREAIAQLRPRLVVWENVGGVLSARADSDMECGPGRVGDGAGGPALRALGRVLGDLAGLGFDAEWCGVRASDVGAPHQRLRVFVVAWPAADAPRDGRHEGRPEPAREFGGPDAALGGGAAADAGGLRRGAGWATAPGQAPQRRALGDAARRSNDHAAGLHLPARGIAWGPYEPAIRRWERTLGRPAPAPTAVSARGSVQLAPAFSEWLMGLPDGWVTDPAIWAGVKPATARRMQLQLLGNGVVPEQAAAAVAHLLARRAAVLGCAA